MKKIKMLSACALAVLLISSTTEEIKGWILRGSKPQSYKIGLVQDTERNGKVAFMESVDEKIKGFGTIMQTFTPKEYYGKTVKLSAFIKTENIKDWAGMWMRIDGEMNTKKNFPKCLGFDNMQDRPIKGNTDWKKYEIILKVDKEAESISYGVLLSSTGKIYLDDIKFEIVSDDTKETQSSSSLNLEKPMNGSFDE